jgi:hypothetical protein
MLISSADSHVNISRLEFISIEGWLPSQSNSQSYRAELDLKLKNEMPHVPPHALNWWHQENGGLETLNANNIGCHSRYF